MGKQGMIWRLRPMRSRTITRIEPAVLGEWPCQDRMGAIFTQQIIQECWGEVNCWKKFGSSICWIKLLAGWWTFDSQRFTQLQLNDNRHQVLVIFSGIIPCHTMPCIYSCWWFWAIGSSDMAYKVLFATGPVGSLGLLDTSIACVSNQFHFFWGVSHLVISL